MTQIPFESHVDIEEDPLAHGGATDIFGRVIWALTAEEEEEMVKKIQSAFGG
jgi:hypothetical protein